ncbi:MAG: ComF family protein, partial [Clostridia bacterium]|nr:ComF family protein [Clostridia bacterium]
YEEPLAESLRNMKRRKNPARASLLAKALEELVAEQGLTFDYITCVPVHWRQKLTRGLNHSEEIAMRLAKYTRIPYCRILQKYLRNKRQSGLTQKERKANVYGVYRLNRRWEGRLAGKTILVVDDIVTTGSTLGEVSRILKMSGATRVHCITVAKSITKYKNASKPHTAVRKRSFFYVAESVEEVDPVWLSDSLSDSVSDSVSLSGSEVAGAVSGGVSLSTSVVGADPVSLSTSVLVSGSVFGMVSGSSAGGFSQGLVGSVSVGSQLRQVTLPEIFGAEGLPRGPGSPEL